MLYVGHQLVRIHCVSVVGSCAVNWNSFEVPVPKDVNILYSMSCVTYKMNP